MKVDDLDEAADGGNQNIIGDVAHVRFTSLPGTPALKAKVDTGADICSLHVDHWVQDGEKVHFTCKKLSPNRISIPMRDHQAVKSASGTQYRPVVELSIKINDKLMNNVMFNLADRSGMDYPVLLGKNALEKGRFLIDPSLAEALNVADVTGGAPPSEDGTALVVIAPTGIEADPASVGGTPDPKEAALKQMYELMKGSDVTFDDLITYIRTQITNTFEDLEY